MKKRCYKLASAVLAFLILVLPGFLSARERRGANLVITLKDGSNINGELIAVRPDSLLLLGPAGKDESVDLVGIRSIRIIRKSKAWSGGLYCFLAGAVLGSVFGYLGSSPEAGKDSKSDNAALGGTALGITAGLIGLGAGALAGKDKTIQLEGKSESAVESALADLRMKARIRDYK